MAENQNGISCTMCKYTIMENVFDKPDFVELNCNRTDISYNTGDVILKQGMFVSQIVYVKMGVVKLVIGENKKSTIIQIVEEKNFVALPVLGNPDTYPFSVVALTDCQVCIIRREAISGIMKKNKKANAYLLKSYHKDYNHLCNRIYTLSTRNNHGKLATVLLYLNSNHFKNNILNIVSRKDIAQLAAISIKSSNNILMDLKKDKIIEVHNNRISVLKPEMLEYISALG